MGTDAHDRPTIGFGGGPPVGTPAGPPPTPGAPRRSAWPLVLFGVVVLAASVAALVAVVADGSDPDDADEVSAVEDEQRASTTTTTSSTTTSELVETTLDPAAPPTLPPVTSTPRLPSSSPATAAPPAAADTGPSAGVVSRTCGARGTGDCFVAVRAAPTSNSAELSRLSEGQSVSVTCTVAGEAVTSSVLGRPTSLWARGVDGRYMSMAFLDVPGWDHFASTAPC